MQTATQADQIAPTNQSEYVTIIAPTIKEVMSQFNSSGLAAQGFAIAGQVARHKFAYVGETANVDLFGGVRMIAATFIRPSSQT